MQTSRRTTRRPQTQSSQSAPGNSTPAPPFTNAPLVHHHSSTSQSASATTQPTYSQPFGYGYGQSGYNPYGAQPQASTSTAPGTISSASTGATTTDAVKAVTSPTSDDNDAAAYEAAQNILNAINFGSLYQLSSEDQTGKDAQPEKTTSGTGVEELLSHLSQAMAEQGNAAQQSNPHPAVPPAPPPDPVVADPRAELQAQLALLAAQFAELAKSEESEPVPAPPQAQAAHPQPMVALRQPALPPMHSLQPPPLSDTAPPAEQSISSAPGPADPESSDELTPAELDFSHLPDPLLDEGEDSDDDDMEEVI